MITREQVEATFNEKVAPNYRNYGQAIRNVQFQQVEKISDEYYWQSDDTWPTGDLDVEYPVWEVTFEVMQITPIGGTVWRKRICYIVEPKSGIYVFE